MVDPEKIADVAEGQTSELEIGGMTAEEQSTWDAMKAGRDIPAAGGEDAPTGDGDDVDDGGADGDHTPDADVAAADDKGGDGEGEKRVPPKTISYGKYQR